MRFTNVAIPSCIILARMAVGSVARATEATAYVLRPLPPLVPPNRKHLSKGKQTLRNGLTAGPIGGPTAAGRSVLTEEVTNIPEIPTGVGPISPSLAIAIGTVHRPTGNAHRVVMFFSRILEAVPRTITTVRFSPVSIYRSTIEAKLIIRCSPTRVPFYDVISSFLPLLLTGFAKLLLPRPVNLCFVCKL